MSAPVLNTLEQRASLSGKKKKKKTIKNVLTVPNNLKIESPIIESSCIKTLVKILERLLPTARIPAGKTSNTKESDKQTSSEPQLKMEAKKKRCQLSLGVNALNRNIKNNLISAVLFADNIQPKFLIHHLNLLCNHKKIPFLHMPSLRETTNRCLGFPCIAVGFKKNSCDFSEAVEEIISISNSNKFSSSEIVSVTDSDEEDTNDEIEEEDKSKTEETPFIYLYRTSTNERIFVPEGVSNAIQNRNSEDFINIEKYSETKSRNSAPKFSLRVKKPLKNLKKLKDFENSALDDDNEDLEVPKKKPKKDWIIHKQGSKENLKYCSPNLMRFPSNPDRKKKLIN